EVIRTYGLETWSKEQYDDFVDDYRTSHLRANTLYGWTRPLVAFLCSAPLVGLVWFGGREVLAGTMSVGLFVTFIRYCERFFNPIRTIAREVHVIQQAFTSAERVASFLSHEEEDVFLGPDGNLAPKRVEGNLEFKDVWMAYDKVSGEQNWVLKGLEFQIKRGEKIGLVGTTGCGKTTTVSLLSRLYEYQKGDILLDGHSLRHFNRSFLRNRIGFVSQDAIIFRGSLKQNLSTDDSIPDDQILYACEVTGLARVMHMGGWTLESEIYEGGANLSVGERQLLSLTRVLIKNPNILILDEATANIDPWFEKIIHQAVDRVMEGRTCLMIAHRLSTLDHCDRILVFEKGKLVEQGSRMELEAMKGHFFQLHQAGETELS
ncbi:MAG: ABC transporter ATP-binding protein/permease, partial [Halobacteriovoraceae bacterium]|nr:ABC transporter ATP-binding protein/permease [Halobacteriovoraceae bacterium]